MSERPFEWKRDGGGLVLFVVGAFVSVLMVKAILSSQPLGEGTGTAAIAALFAGSFGAFPCLVFAAGVAFLGARSFLTASEAGALRHALGLVGCTIGLAILFGAFSDTGGGKFGLLTGGWIGLATHATLGALTGVLVILATVWFTWMRESPMLYEEQIRSSVTERSEVADPGVTAAEAAGLIPEDLPPVEARARMSSPALPQVAPPSPYPEDVRLKGQVPPGARPIAVQNAASAYTAPSLVAPEPPARPVVEPVQPFGAGANVAPAASAAALPIAPAVRPLQPVPAGAVPIAPADEELNSANEDRVRIEDAQADAGPERPSWERTGLGEDDEPVDAYGTPLSLIETLRKAQEEMIAIPESPAAELETEVEEELEPLILAEEEELDSEELQEDLEDEPALAAATPEEIDAAEMEESEEFASEEEEEEELLEITEELVPADVLAEPMARVEEPVEAEAEELADSKAIAQTTIFDFTDEKAGVELFPEGVPEPAAEETAPEPVAEVVAEAPSEPEGEIEIEIGEEPEVMLQPQAAPANRAHKSPSTEPARAKLLAEAGCLFVERGRVAVSMLQRQYGMDFDEACKVLDELQDLGLIGPYLGGQSRDILLTRDQWLEKAGAI